MEKPYPIEREILRPFALPDEQSRMVDLEDFRQSRNLVLVFVKEVVPAAERLLGELATAAEAVAAEEGVVLAVLSGKKQEAASLRERLGLPFKVLADEGGKVVDSFCGAGLAIYVTDRFREVFAVGRDDRMLSGDEVRKWLAHINRQCPECGVAEWPA